MTRSIFFAAIAIVVIFNFNHSSASLKDAANQADYLLIYHQDFELVLNDFIEWREAKGLKVFPVNVEDIYEEFGEGKENNLAIWDFISYALENWQKPAPAYVLIAGSTNHIPSFRVLSQFSGNPELNEDSVSIDNWYSVNQHGGDNIPDIALGRFPARNVQDMINIIDKTIFFEDDLREVDYNKDFLFFIGEKYYDHMESQANGLISMFPDQYKYAKTSNKTDSPYYTDKEKFIDKLREGTLFLANFNATNSDLWCHDDFLNYEDIENYDLGDVPFINTSFGSIHNFDNPERYGMIDAMIVKENGGSVASLASAGLNYSGIIGKFMMKFYEQALSDQNKKIGDVILKVQADLNYGNEEDNHNRRFTLLGDPALKIPVDILMSVDLPDRYTEDQEDSPVLCSSYPNPFSSHTKISFTATSNEKVKIDIFNPQGVLIRQLTNSTYPAGEHSLTWMPGNIPSGRYVARITIGTRLVSLNMSVLK